MMRPLHIWIVFGLCLAVVLAGMGWISLTVLQMDREARRHASLEENVRYALWRMESALSPLIAQESARPYFSYSAFYAPERAYSRMYAELKQGEVQVPSPLLTQIPPYILLHFQLGADGDLTSPQVPTGNMKDIAETSYVSHEDVEAFAARLRGLRGLVKRDELIAALPPQKGEAIVPGVVPRRLWGEGALAGLDEQTIRNTSEWQARTYNQMILQSNIENVLFPRSSGVVEGMMKPVWIGSVLTLARLVSVNGQDYVQGCWLDWPAIREWLLGGVKDLVPAADLKPVLSGEGGKEGRMLAALPVKLMPGPVPVPVAGGISAVQVSLFIVWGCVLLAAVAVAALLRGALSLSERRGAFVSAVTHELRTPLTTLSMYTEMLAEGIVSGEEKTRGYLETLRSEAERLGHLVENVLAYARLEGRRPGGRVEPVPLFTLLDRVRDRLAQRAEQSGMKLAVECDGELSCVRAVADISAVEHILFNLVDNACKYAASAHDGLIHLEAGCRGGFVSLRVRDHGPGVDKRDARRLFRPFCKSARDAANSMPGVGLGLALSRRLARAMGGDLRLDQTVSDGASFVLTLPAEISPAS